VPVPRLAGRRSISNGTTVCATAADGIAWQSGPHNIKHKWQSLSFDGRYVEPCV